MKISLRFAVIVGVMLALTVAAFAAPLYWSAEDRDLGLVRPKALRGSHGSLDEDYTQFRYLKTEDYGATWTSLQQAGDYSTVEQLTGSPPNFSGIVTATNEVCFANVSHDTVLSTPGVYTLTGPDFTPVLAIPEGDNSFDAEGSGWTDMCRTPTGDLILITWGHDAAGGNSLWAVASSDNGASWGAPWVVMAEPALDASAQYFHLAHLTSSDYAFCQFQTEGDEGFDQHVMRIPLDGGAAAVTALNAYSAVYYSYYSGNCKPLAYDPDGGDNGALYAVFRNADVSATAVFYSGDQGMTFSGAEIPGAQRYPTLALNAENATPWVVSNHGVGDPGEHCAWYSYDEFGYNGGSWTEPTDFACTPFDGGNFWLFYMNQGFWWDADRGVASLNLWGNFTPDGINATYTSDGGATWAEDVPIYHYEDDEMDAGTVQNCELVGGSGGTAYIITSGMTGLTDLEGPVVTNQTLDPSTPATTLGPWVISAHITDNVSVDAPDWIQLEYMFDPVDGGVYAGEWGADSCQGCDENNQGTWFFTLPGEHRDGSEITLGDIIWLHVWATDPPGNSGYGPDQAIVAGVEFLGVDDPTAPLPDDFKLLTNYPNPFNPSTRIEFQVPYATHIDLKIYNTLGQEVAVLADNLQIGPGLFGYTFDASDLPSGVYIYRLSSDNFSDSRKMVLVK